MDFLLIGRSRFAQRRVLPAAAALPFDSVTVASRREGTHWRTLTGRSPGLVYVSLANGEHAEAVEWALRSGHHVVVDKPAFLTLPEGATGTTTIESKTNFLGGGPVGAVLVGEAIPVKIGKRLSVWQTRIRTEEGAEVALVTQTQMVLWPA